MRRQPRRLSHAAVAVAVTLCASSAWAEPPSGAPLLRLLGSRAQEVLAPGRTTVGALVRIPTGVAPSSLGLEPFVPGLARLHASPAALLAFTNAHPGLPLEVATRPHLLLDQVGRWTHAATARAAYGVDGTGTLVGVADTGIDVSLADFMDETGHTRVAWLLDLSNPKGVGLYPSLEKQFGGAVYQGTDLDHLLATGAALPIDPVGHGTHVSSIAAGNGGQLAKYVGIAPRAQIIFARITTDSTQAITNDDLLTGVSFLFNRADAMHMPMAANLSIGSDFGPHDGTTAWETAIASYVGGSQPGRAVVVAAGNSGDITAGGIHASVFVPPGGARSVPITTQGASNGSVQVWVTMRQGANLNVGLDGPQGTWIDPVSIGQQGSVSTSAYQAGVYNGSTTDPSDIPAASRSAIAVWQGSWPSGTYAVTLTGSGTADLYLESTGDAAGQSGNAVSFQYGVREGTITLPATHPALIAVGCTVNRPSWNSIDNGLVTVGITPLDPRGGYPLADGGSLLPVSGDVCWFSSAGPTVTGVPKPEVSAPGGIVIGAMSQAALPEDSNSIFANAGCPPVVDGGPPDPRCMQVDPSHAVAVGTSMSAPQAAGLAALLFERDPTLTQDQIVALLQAGTHAFRDGAPRFEDQSGPGELDVQGSLDALSEMQNPELVLPDRGASWITLSADVVAADGSTPLTAIVELRTAGGAHRADLFAASRLRPDVLVGGLPLTPLPSMIRRGPGVWFFTVTPPPGLGGQNMTLGATFDGAPIVSPRTVAIATETWTANYPSSAKGASCSVGRARRGTTSPAFITLLALGLMSRRASRRGRTRRRSR